MSAHGPLARTDTAPGFGARPNGNANGVVHSISRSSQLSGSTVYTNSSSTTLASVSSSATLVPMPQANGGAVHATNNIINQRADASRSLYQICVNLRQRLAQVPGFDAHLNDSDDDDEGEEDMDPVSSLWRCLRKGVPLITIYNVIRPAEQLQIDENVSEAKRPKAAAFKFVAACMKDLNLPPGECFALTDLFGDDTTGFVKASTLFCRSGLLLMLHPYKHTSFTCHLDSVSHC